MDITTLTFDKEGSLISLKELKDLDYFLLLNCQ
jgi:hypothetical protein